MHRPDPINGFLLLVGVAVGVVLGPCGWGRYVQQTVMDRSSQGQVAQKALDVFDQQHALQRQRLADTGVTQAALVEFEQNHRSRRQALELRAWAGRHQDLQRMVGQSVAMVAAVLFIMAMEIVVASPARGRLTTARYAIMAVWITVVLMGPAWRQMPIVFLSLLIGIVCMAVWMPLKTVGRSCPVPKR